MRPGVAGCSWVTVALGSQLGSQLGYPGQPADSPVFSRLAEAGAIAGEQVVEPRSLSGVCEGWCSAVPFCERWCRTPGGSPCRCQRSKLSAGTDRDCLRGWRLVSKREVVGGHRPCLCVECR